MNKQMELFKEEMTLEQVYNEHMQFKAKMLQYVRLLLAKQHDIAKLALEMHETLLADEEAKEKVAAKASKIEEIIKWQEGA